LEHEWNVLQQHPRGAMLADEAKDFLDKAGSGATDAGGQTGLAKILAGEAGGNECRAPRQFAEGRDVGVVLNVWESHAQDGHRARVVLAQENRLVAGAMQSAFETADASKQPCNLVGHSLWR